MTRPSDHPSGQEASSEAKRFKLREGVMINPGFRDAPPDEPIHHKGHRPKRFSNPRDQKNLLYGIIAVIVVLVILVLLELKQLRDGAVERVSHAVPAEQSK